MNAFIFCFLDAAAEFEERHWSRPPECWIKPTDGDRAEFREIMNSIHPWLLDEFIRSGTAAELDLLLERILLEHYSMKNTALMSVLEAMAAADNRGEAVPVEMVEWFREKKFGFPPFSFEKEKAAEKKFGFPPFSFEKEKAAEKT
jgi:hypothetical protein